MNEREFLTALRKTPRRGWFLLNSQQNGRRDGRMEIRYRHRFHNSCPITEVHPDKLTAMSLRYARTDLNMTDFLVHRVVTAADNRGCPRLRRKLLEATGLVTEERRLKREFARRTS